MAENIICIVCPLGSGLEVEIEGEEIKKEDILGLRVNIIAGRSIPFEINSRKVGS